MKISLTKYCLFLLSIVFFFFISLNSFSTKNKPYHHLEDGTFRNPEGSPKRDPNVNWSYKIFNQEKKKLDMTVPKEHVVSKDKVLSDLKKYQDDDSLSQLFHQLCLQILGFSKNY